MTWLKCVSSHSSKLMLKQTVGKDTKRDRKRDKISGQNRKQLKTFRTCLNPISFYLTHLTKSGLRQELKTDSQGQEGSEFYGGLSKSVSHPTLQILFWVELKWKSLMYGFQTKRTDKEYSTHYLINVTNMMYKAINLFLYLQQIFVIISEFNFKSLLSMFEILVYTEAWADG